MPAWSALLRSAPVIVEALSSVMPVRWRPYWSRGKNILPGLGPLREARPTAPAQSGRDLWAVPPSRDVLYPPEN